MMMIESQMALFISSFIPADNSKERNLITINKLENIKRESRLCQSINR